MFYGAFVHTGAIGRGIAYGAAYGALVGVILTWFALDIALGLPLSPTHMEDVGPLSVPINLARVLLHVVYGVILGAIAAWMSGRGGASARPSRLRGREA